MSVIYCHSLPPLLLRTLCSTTLGRAGVYGTDITRLLVRAMFMPFASCFCQNCLSEAMIKQGRKLQAFPKPIGHRSNQSLWHTWQVHWSASNQSSDSGCLHRAIHRVTHTCIMISMSNDIEEQHPSSGPSRLHRAKMHWQVQHHLELVPRMESSNPSSIIFFWECTISVHIECKYM